MTHCPVRVEIFPELNFYKKIVRTSASVITHFNQDKKVNILKLLHL